MGDGLLMGNGLFVFCYRSSRKNFRFRRCCCWNLPLGQFVFYNVVDVCFCAGLDVGGRWLRLYRRLCRRCRLNRFL